MRNEERDVAPEEKTESTRKPAKPTLDFRAMTTREALRKSGERITGFRNKRQLFEQLKQKGYPVEGL